MKVKTDQILPIVLKTLIILVAGILLGALLLTIAYCLPVNMGSYHATQVSIELQGWYPNVPNITNTYNTYFHSYLPGVLDNNTVRSHMLPITWASGENPLYTAMDCNGYSYYWHGYVIFTRLLQLFMSYEQIQMASSFLQIGVIVMLAILIGQKKGMKYAVMLISSYCLLMPMAMAVCLQYYSVFFITFGACLVLFARSEWFEKGNRLFYFFLVVGMMTSYFDLLTFPLLTWGFPMVWWIAINRKEENIWNSLKKVVLLGIAWIIGYGGMWLGKWILATIILQKNVILEAFKEILLRSGADNQVVFGQTNRFYAVYMNWKHYTYKLYVIILVAWLIYWLVSGMLYGWKKINAAKVLSYLLVGASGIVWCMVLMNHTEVHHTFTYRILGIGLAVFFAIILESTEHVKKKPSMKHIFRFMSIGIVLAVCAGSLALCAKEITQLDNKSSDFVTKAIEDELHIRFVPKYDKILGIGLGLLTKSETGQYELTLSDENAVLYTESIPAASYDGANYKDIVVDWDLKAGKEYTIHVKIQNVNKKVYAYYTEEGFLPLEGCQYYEGEDVLTNTQPLLGIQYWCRPTSMKDLALLALTYWGLGWMIVYGWSCVRDKFRV